MNYNGAESLEFGGDNTNIDPSVRRELPEGCTVVSTDSHGVSFWANIGRINVTLVDGTEQSFFIKVMSKERGKEMVISEFESMSAISSVIQEFVPKPIAWGTYETIPDAHFFLCEFREMADDMPEPHKFAALLSTLHQNSHSPTGKFGFHITTYAGNLPQAVEWEDSWETFFTKSLRKALDLEIERKGPDEELDVLMEALFDRVIPRLLRPLESDGRTVKPSLVHGDLWYANSGIDVNNDQSLVFDACCFYAHNEYEFGQWRPECNRFGEEYIAAYTSFAQVSAPQEDFEGRLDLYRLRFDTHVSALFTENETLRTQVLDLMRDLVERYGQPDNNGVTKGATMDSTTEGTTQVTTGTEADMAEEEMVTLVTGNAHVPVPDSTDDGSHQSLGGKQSIETNGALITANSCGEETGRDNVDHVREQAVVV